MSDLASLTYSWVAAAHLKACSRQDHSLTKLALPFPAMGSAVPSCFLEFCPWPPWRMRPQVAYGVPVDVLESKNFLQPDLNLFLT